MTLTEYLDAVKARREAATPGPWTQSEGHKGYKNYVIQTHHITRDVWEICGCYNDGEVDAAFIASMPADSAKMEACLRIAVEAFESYENNGNIDYAYKALADMEKIANDGAQ